jgi:uncharacterized membrane protein HdeD (DUF308 family)
MAAVQTPAVKHQAKRVMRILRALYLVRILFAVTWVVLVSALAPSTRGDGAGLLIGLLLVVYPASDAIASIFEIRADRSMTPAWQYVNLVAGGLTALAVAATAFYSVPTAISIFGVWAIISGAIQTAVALIRRPRMRGQWPLILSGIGSILGGLEYLSWSGTAIDGLNALAIYTEGGAFFYLLTVGWLFLANRWPWPAAQ